MEHLVVAINSWPGQFHAIVLDAKEDADEEIARLVRNGVTCWMLPVEHYTAEQAANRRAEIEEWLPGES